MNTKLRIEVVGGNVTAVYSIDEKGNTKLLAEDKDYELIDYDNLEAEREL